MAAKKAEPQSKPEPETKPEEVSEKTQDSTEQPAASSIGGDQSPKPKKKFYKRAWFWVVIVAAVILIGLGIFFGIRISQQNKNKQIISQGWHDLVLESNTVAALGDKVTNQETFNAYSTELHKLDNMVDDKEFAAQKLAGNYQDVQQYKTFLTDFNRYTTDGARYSDDVINFSDSDNTALTDLSKIAKDSANTLKNNTKYLTDDMPPKIFEIQNVLFTQKTNLTNQAASAAAKQAQTQAQAAADAKNLATVQANTNSFQNAYIAGNAAQMRQYMTQAFQNEYDFNQLTPESRQYTYPVSFRIISTVKNADGTYTVKVNMLYKNHSDSSQYTVGQELSFVNVSGAWLVNTLKEGSGY